MKQPFPSKTEVMDTEAALATTSGSAMQVQVSSIDNSFGALLLGTFFSLMSVLLQCSQWCLVSLSSVSLYGLVLHQVYRYTRLHPHDYPYIQVLVSGLRFAHFFT